MITILTLNIFLLPLFLCFRCPAPDASKMRDGLRCFVDEYPYNSSLCEFDKRSCPELSDINN